MILRKWQACTCTARTNGVSCVRSPTTWAAQFQTGCGFLLQWASCFAWFSVQGYVCYKLSGHSNCYLKRMNARDQDAAQASFNLSKHKVSACNSLA